MEETTTAKKQVMLSLNGTDLTENTDSTLLAYAKKSFLDSNPLDNPLEDRSVEWKLVSSYTIDRKLYETWMDEAREARDIQPTGGNDDGR